MVGREQADERCTSLGRSEEATRALMPGMGCACCPMREIASGYLADAISGVTGGSRSSGHPRRVGSMLRRCFARYGIRASTRICRACRWQALLSGEDADAGRQGGILPEAPEVDQRQIGSRVGGASSNATSCSSAPFSTAQFTQRYSRGTSLATVTRFRRRENRRKHAAG